jgi:hypothetical protein
VSVLPLPASDLEAASARPAARVGVHLEPELIGELMADMADQPGALPLFQYVLTELFERRTGSVLTRAAYRGLGGLQGALSRRADEVWAGLERDQQATARRVLLRLVSGGSSESSWRVSTPKAKRWLRCSTLSTGPGCSPSIGIR